MRLKLSTNDVVTNSRKILHTTSANKNYRVLLKVMPDARNIARYLHAGRKAHAGNLAKG
jgi:hypothetical protein